MVRQGQGFVVEDVKRCKEPGKVIIMWVLMRHVHPASSAGEPVEVGKGCAGLGL